MVTLDYFRDAAYGTRLYLVKEKPENIPRARITFKCLQYLDIATKSFLTYWIIKKLLNYMNMRLY